MATTTPKQARGPVRPSDAEPVVPSVPRPGRWAAPQERLPDVAPTFRAVRAELAELRARLDR